MDEGIKEFSAFIDNYTVTDVINIIERNGFAVACIIDYYMNYGLDINNFSNKIDFSYMNFIANINNFSINRVLFEKYFMSMYYEKKLLYLKT